MDELLPPFSDLPEPVQQGIRDLGWRNPTPVQERVIAPMRSGRDLIVQAHTGSGKTGAFGITIACVLDPGLAACQALVLVPTRELANQVAEEVGSLVRPSGLRCLPIYGGVGYQKQLDGIAAGAHVIVGTPGRILDHLGAKRLSFDEVRILIFDEADELLSLGFWPDMKEIRTYLPSKRQSCLFSATIPERVQSLSRVFLRDPEFVSLSEGQVAPSEIEHSFVVTTAQEKDANLQRLLEYYDSESAIVFCNTKSDVRYVTAFLQRNGFDADQISGDLAQAAREQAMGRIKAGNLRILVATDVAARGIDISDLGLVIGYTAPDSPEVYVHRTGRTGRAGKAGIAISLVSGLDIGNFRYLQQVNKITIRERKIPTEALVTERLRERLEVKIEQEVRPIPERERRHKIDRFVPVVVELAASEEGRRDLAAICAAYLAEHKPVIEPSLGPASAEPAAAEAAAPPRADDEPGDRGGSRPRRRGRRRPRG
jgi:ATP-dependent RNA helicase DeaD